MDWLTALKDWYEAYLEPTIDAMSNGEATLFASALALLGFLALGLIKKLFNKSKKENNHPEVTPPTVHVTVNTQTPDSPKVETMPPPETEPKNTPKPSSTNQKPLPSTHNSKLFGRKKEHAMLTRAWHNDKQNIVILKAMGGTGKTALLNRWLDGFNDASKRTPYDKLFTYSFYSQGAAEDKQADADEFFNNALAFFGYQGAVLTSAYEKGIVLAECINQQRSLLVLDGLEPLQHPVGSMQGALKDKGLVALLSQLATHNQGLCLISSRQSVVELANKPLVIAHNLEQLAPADAVRLLKSYGIKDFKHSIKTQSEIQSDTQSELERTVKEYGCHALTLNLLGNYIKTVYQGDIRQRDKIPALTDEPTAGQHAEKVMVAYEIHLKDTAELSILYMMGLFDRPVSMGAITVLSSKKILPSFKLSFNWFKQFFTSHKERLNLFGNIKIADKQWHYTIEQLRQQQLLNSPDPQQPNNLDCHPLIREYFGKRLKQIAPDAWQQAHQQLYHYYKALPEKQQPDTLEEMQPLFAAIAHGCAAGLHQQALEEVYYPRIMRDDDSYLCKQLGAFGADLSVIAHFFEQHWHIPAAGLTDYRKSFVLNWAAFALRALGRQQEAVELMQAGMELCVKQENWRDAAIDGNNLSELQLTRGDINAAIDTANKAVQWADKSGDLFYRIITRTTLANTLQQAGQEEEHLFKHAEALQQEGQHEYPQLYSVQGFQYCYWLLTAGQWEEVQQRAEYSLELAKQYFGLLAIALDQLSLGRASLQKAIALWREHRNKEHGNLEPNNTAISPEAHVFTPSNYPINPAPTQKHGDGKKSEQSKETSTTTLNTTKEPALSIAEGWLNQAIDGLRKAGTEDHLPQGLLARASYHRFCLSPVARMQRSKIRGIATEHDMDELGGESPVFRKLHTANDSVLDLALKDLQETHDIAQRGGMLLFLCDYHLESARLALTVDDSIFDQTAAQHIAEAEQLILQTGYQRRMPELEYLTALQAKKPQ